LSLHRVLGNAEKCFDTQILLDQLHFLGQ
jgi:hypothetical protein